MAKNGDDLVKVELEKINFKDKSILENMLQLYIYENTNTIPVEVNKQGRYEYDNLDYYWIHDNYFPYFIKVENKLAGFALINNYFKVIKDGNWSVSEFFVLNKYKRKGIGSLVMKKLFKIYKGKWEISILPNSKHVERFWDNVIVKNNIDIEKIIINDNNQVVYIFDVV